MSYSKEELLLLSRDVLANIILEQDRRLNLSRRGQPKRDHLVGKTFGALTVVGDAGNQQAHSIWHCRCSGNIYDSKIKGVCDNQVTFWGSNLKAERHQYCGNESCPAARQVLAMKRQKELPRSVIARTNEFEQFLQDELVDKFALMGERAGELINKEKEALVSLLHNYYGLNEQGRAYLISEISSMLNRNDVSQIKRQLEEHLIMYRLDCAAKEIQGT